MSNRKLSVKEAIDFIKSQDIVDALLRADVIEEDKLRGRKYLCPFHDEKTASLNFYDNNYYCFGCAASGDAIKFVESVYDIGFIQALKLICDSYEIDLIENKIVNPFLKGSPIPSSSNRVKSQALESEWQSYLKQMENAPDKILDGAEIFFPLEVGYDSKINYYVLRFTSKTGKTLAFTKRRAFETDDKSKFPKWKHSKKEDSNIEECASCFNLGGAIRDIRTKREIIIVEGPKDVIPFIKEKRNNVISISGTHHFKEAYNIIPKECERFVLSLDSDSAGRKGIVDIASFLSDKIPLESVFCIEYEGGLDPFDYYDKNGKIPEEIPILSFLDDQELRKVYMFSNSYNRERIIKAYSERENLGYYQAKDFLTMNNLTREIKKRERESEIERLIERGDSSSLKKLKLKYGLNISDYNRDEDLSDIAKEHEKEDGSS